MEKLINSKKYYLYSNSALRTLFGISFVLFTVISCSNPETFVSGTVLPPLQDGGSSGGTSVGTTGNSTGGNSGGTTGVTTGGTTGLNVVLSREFVVTQQKIQRPVKLFFIIDDSPSMDQFQTSLKNSTAGLLDAIGSDFVGEIHSVTTTELLNDGVVLPGDNLAPITYPELQNDASIITRTITTGSGTRYHGNLAQLLPTTGVNGLISPIRQLFSLDGNSVNASPWKATDGQDRQKSILSIDSYKQIKSSLVGLPFTGGSDQVSRLTQTLHTAIVRGAGGSSNEQPYCALIHVLKDTGRLSIFKPEDKVAFIFLQHGEADLIQGETCISGYEMVAAPEANVYYGLGIYSTYYSGLVEERLDQNDQFRPSNIDHRFFVFDCDGTNNLCTASPTQIANSKAARLASPLGTAGQTTVDCSGAEEDAYEYYLKNTFSGKADFVNTSGEAKKIYVRGNCKKTFGFSGIPGSISGLYPVALPVSSFGKPCSDPDVRSAVLTHLNLFKLINPHKISDPDLCSLASQSPYSMLNQNKKVYFEVNGQILNETAGPAQYAAAVKTLMDQKIGPSNYIVTAITSLGTGSSLCDPADFKASSLINLVNGLLPNHGISTSLCNINYMTALEPVSQFALFEPKRQYVAQELADKSRLVRLRVVSPSGNSREIALDKITFAPNKQSFLIDRSVDIQAGEKIILEYGPELVEVNTN